MISATEALKRLKEGNQRFVSGRSSSGATADVARRSELATSGQSPFAVILGCSDSRVPVEMVFDQGLGNLFVIRVAGNIAARSAVGSVEYAAENFGSPLVVVLGHSKCGAIRATLDAIKQVSDVQSPNLHSIVDRIRPSVETLLDDALNLSEDQVTERAVRANISATVNHLSDESMILENLIQQKKLKVVGAEYCLETGIVEFMDNTAETG